MIGYAKAMELSLLGEAVSAEKAVDLGLASRVIPAASWEKEIRDFAEKVASLPTRAIALMKHCLQKTFETPLPQMLEYEAAAQKAAGRTTDHREGIRAFLEKRKARFSGR
ncbi:Enoyl-CoA hydratase/carnithine racemase [Caldibacillus debilis GB1]|uniref:Enoyl-CoA hydratase/carnithine racemase n=1 Tax=Caldibacillus debilis GB1 TaxID=1339248 RepID=A0A420VJB1_9BACI|nr:Enoyl-CoA hydratase/carnithine racemase [Caldibacillus debilis GB1]